jgi:putative FmdB family regulatory protein
MFYEYKCPTCNTIEEKSHSIKEEPIFKCPECSSVMKRIIFGGAGTHFKGIGWAFNNTATNPKMQRYHVKELVGPKFLKNAIRK